MVLILLVAVLLGAFGAVLLALGLVFMRKHSGFNRRAERVVGVVVGHDEVLSTSSAIHRRVFFPRVRYPAGGGRELEAKAPGESSAPALGFEIELLVDPQHPDQVSFTGPRGGAGMATGLAGMGCAVMMLAVASVVGLVVLFSF